MFEAKQPNENSPGKNQRHGNSVKTNPQAQPGHAKPVTPTRQTVTGIGRGIPKRSNLWAIEGANKAGITSVQGSIALVF